MPEEATVVTTEPVAKTEQKPGEVVTPESDAVTQQPEPGKGRRYLERKLSRLMREKAEAQARASVLEEQLGRRDVKAPDQPGAPKPEAYQTYAEYLEALADWKADQKVEAKLKAYSEDQDKRRRDESEAKALAQWNRYMAEAEKKYDDWDEVVGDSEVEVSAAMFQAMRESDIAGDIMYYLGKHPDEAERIAALSPAASAKEIGKLEAKLASEAPKKRASDAPAPIDPVGGNKTPAGGPSEGDSMGDWIKKRRAQLKVKT